jgi:hypothetical protein
MMNEANTPNLPSNPADLLSELERSLEANEPVSLEDVFATSTETASSPELNDQLLNLFAIAEETPLEASNHPSPSLEPVSDSLVETDAETRGGRDAQRHITSLTATPDGHTDWQSLAQALEAENEALQQSVAQLQQQLETQKRRSQSADTLIAQQAEELNRTQEQTSHLLNELDASQQTAQRQQLLIETLTEQLETRQAQVAQLERECVLLQEDCNDQAHKLIAAEKQIRELQSRLHRQQRYTLQYKAALEQCLGSPNADVPDLNPTVQTIQPWSNQGASPDKDPIAIATVSTLSTDETGAELVAQTHPWPSPEEILPAEALQDDNSEPLPQSTPPAPPRSSFLTPLSASHKRPPKGMVDLPSFLRHR